MKKLAVPQTFKLRSPAKHLFALTLATISYYSASSIALDSNIGTLENGILTTQGNTLRAIRHGNKTAGAELWSLNAADKWFRESLSFTTFSDLAGVDALTTENGKLHLIGAENGSVFYMSLPSSGPQYFGQRKNIFGPKIKGAIGMTYSSFGNLEIIAPMVDGGLALWFGDEEGNQFTQYKKIFENRQFADVAIIQSSYDGLRLEAVVREGNKLIHLVRENGNGFPWVEKKTIATNANGQLALIEENGTLRLVAEKQGNGLAHYTYNSANDTWTLQNTFGTANYSALGFAFTSNNNTFNVMALKNGGNFDYFKWQGSQQPQKVNVSQNSKLLINGGNAIISGKSNGIVGIHTTLLPSGKLLTLGYSDNSAQTGVARVYDPNSGATETLNLEERNMFCSGHGLMPNGDVLVAGGHTGPTSQLKLANIYRTGTNQWETLDELNFGRWYPTITTIYDGRMMILSGSKSAGKGGDMNNSLQYYDYTKDSLSNAIDLPKPFTQSYNYTDTNSIAMYPFAYQLPDGKVAVHSGDTTRLFNPVNSTWQAAQYTNVVKRSRNYPVQTGSVLLPLKPDNNYQSEIMVFGGAGKNYEEGVTIDTPAIKTVERINLSAGSPSWKKVPDMQNPRVLAKSVILPDDNIAVLGGSSKGWADNVRDPVATVEAYNPDVNTWTTWNPIAVPRLYHSTATLMPDATILLTGTDKNFNKEPYKAPQHRVEIFKPPYLFKGARPQINSAPNSTSYNDTMTVQMNTTMAIKNVRFIKTGSSTHAFDMSQRSIALEFSQNGKTLTIETPPNGKIAPPGHYMLFALNNNGVPSVAKIIQID